MRKLIFFDIDGTIAAERTGYIPESTIRAIRNARENGHLVFINTGRTASSVEDSHREIGFDGYVYGCGTSVYTEGKYIFQKELPAEKCKEIAQMARKTKVVAVYESDEMVFFDSTLPAQGIVKMLMEKYKDWATFLSEELEEELLFEKFCFWVTEESDFDGFYEYIKDDFECIDRGKGMYELVQKGLSKATGIQVLMDYYRVPLEDCYAVGDSTNDLAMLQFVPNSIAMGNSQKEILPYCAYHTAKLEEDGIEKALKYYGII